MQFALFPPQQGTEVHPLFSILRNHSWNLGLFPEFPRFHIRVSWSKSIYHLTQYEWAASNYTIDFWAVHRGFSSPNGEFRFWIPPKKHVGSWGEFRPFFQGNKNGGELNPQCQCHLNQKVQAQLTRFLFVNGVFNLLKEGNYLNLVAKFCLNVQYLEFSGCSKSSFNWFQVLEFENNIPRQQLLQTSGLKTLPTSLFQVYDPRVGDYLQFFKTGERGRIFLLVARQNGGLDLYQINFNFGHSHSRSKDFLGSSKTTLQLVIWTIAVSGQTQPDLFTVDQNGKIWKLLILMNIATRSAVLLELGIRIWRAD